MTKSRISNNKTVRNGCYSTLLAVLAPLCASVAVVSANAAELQNFEIAAGNAAEALRSFSAQSGLQMLFEHRAVKDHKTRAVLGQYEPEKALAILLQESGLVFEFVNKRTVAIRNKKVGNAKPQSDAVESDASALSFATATVQLAQADVEAQDDGSVKSTKSKNAQGNKEAIEEMVVEEGRIRPFSDANVDRPRTINDPQPYYIFDSETIERSAALNVEDFLKQRLTMNTTAQTTSQQTVSPNTLGSTSGINLRGLGADKTLVLINGRRLVGPNLNSLATQRPPSQPDLNGIPLSAIDRIEVLPSSASGIYGASALGGVVNVVLKNSYNGGEVRASYDNTWDTDSPSRTVGFSYGTGFNGGKTQLMLSGQWSDTESLRLQDRQELYLNGLSKVLSNSQSFVYSGAFLGATPNITAAFVQINGQFVQPQLTLKNGVSLGSITTYIPSGISPSTPQADLYAGLLANAGKWNFEMPSSVQSPTGLRRQLTLEPTEKSFMVSVRHALTAGIDVNLDWSRFENNSVTPYSSLLPNSYTVSSTHPNSPFTSDVNIIVPHAEQIPFVGRSETDSVSLGLLAKLRGNWIVQADYTWSSNRLLNRSTYFDSFALGSAVYSPGGAFVGGVLYPTLIGAFPAAGVINPFVDTLQYPLDYQRFMAGNNFQYDMSATMNNLAVRSAGPLWTLPWGTPNMSVGIERRISATPDNYRDSIMNIVTAGNMRTQYFAREQITDSGYVEVLVPLVRKEAMPLLYSAELQVSGRMERYEIDVGTPYADTSLITGVVTYAAPTLNGQPIFARDSYSSANKTFGLKYQPVKDVTLRASLATAFLPPTPTQLIKNPLPNSGLTSVLDPQRNNSQVQVSTISGGNPDLVPQNSKSWNAGMIWEPSMRALRGVRFDAEYYRIEQYDAIGSLPAQTLIAYESTYPGRVVRNASGAITFVDTSLVNLYSRDTEGWDLSADYQFESKLGTFNLRAIESIVLHLKEQYSLTQPAYDRVNFPSEGGAGKYKANLQLTWDYRHLSAGWSTRYFSSYKQFGTLGGPNATQTLANNPNAALNTTYVKAQGGNTIPSQMYHDVFLSYSFEKTRGRGASTWRAELLSGFTVQMGVKNVFDKTPPFDVFYDYYISPYGDTRLRSYWLSAKKSF